MIGNINMSSFLQEQKDDAWVFAIGCGVEWTISSLILCVQNSSIVYQNTEDFFIARGGRNVKRRSAFLYHVVMKFLRWLMFLGSYCVSERRCIAVKLHNGFDNVRLGFCW